MSLRGRTRWVVECDCGTIKTVLAQTLRPGAKSRSCGCAIENRRIPIEDRRKRQKSVADKLRTSRAEAGVCFGCGGAVEDPTYCHCVECRTTHAARSTKSRKKRVDSGTCTVCSLPCVAAKLCLRHWFGRVASSNTGSRANWPVVESLWQEQNGKCAYSGEVLVPGTNASLDHKTPRSRGGSDDRENLQWVTWKINRMKTDMTHDEFVSLCGLITTRSTATP